MINIVFCTDSNYVMPTGIAMISICENNKKERISFHVIVTSKDAQNKTLLPQLESVAKKYQTEYYEYHLLSDSLSVFGKSKIGHISLTTFARFFIPSLLPKDIKKVLYLDSDIIVNDSLRELWETEIPMDCPLAAVEDANGTSGHYHKAVETDLTIPYFNAGVLIINLDYWRSNYMFEKVSECISDKLSQFEMMDQDILNYLIRDSAIILPMRYNYQTIFRMHSSQYWMVSPDRIDELIELEEGKISPIIIHYITANKPWKKCWCPLREVWERYETLSIWAGQKRQELLSRPDRTIEFKDLEKVYWRDGNLMLEMLPEFTRLFDIATHMKNHRTFMQFGIIPLKLISRLLENVYRIKGGKV